jgi:hypothetical protein
MSAKSYARWLAENDSHCRNAFNVSGQEFARRWRAGEYGAIDQYEDTGNWQDELILRLGQSLDAADGRGYRGYVTGSRRGSPVTCPL